MWSRKTEFGKWNGNVLNILSTSLDGGKRLHVSEMPYTDLPHIKVMGAKARTVSIDVIFVGANSLDDANAVVLELETNPEGTLEHPYLGELNLVYETSSQSFSTKKGLVKLSLKFYRQGEALELIDVDSKTPRQLVDAVSQESNTLFVSEVANAEPDFIDEIKAGLNSVVTALRNIANRSAQSSVNLAAIHRQIEDGFAAIEMITNAPAAFSEHFLLIVDSLKDALIEKEESEDSSDNTNSLRTNSAVSGRAVAIGSLSQTINNDAESFHCNLLITSAIVLLSQEVELLNTVEKLSVDDINNQSLDQMFENITVIQNQLNNRLSDVTQSAIFESMALVNAVESLRKNVNEQEIKLTELKQSLVEYEVPIARPLVCIAQSLGVSTSALSSLNNIKHPLFVNGSVTVPNV